MVTSLVYFDHFLENLKYVESGIVKNKLKYFFGGYEIGNIYFCFFKIFNVFHPHKIKKCYFLAKIRFKSSIVD